MRPVSKSAVRKLLYAKLYLFHSNSDGAVHRDRVTCVHREIKQRNIELAAIDQHGAGNGRSFDVKWMPHAERVSQQLVKLSNSNAQIEPDHIIGILPRERHEPPYQRCCRVGRPRSHPDGWEQRAFRGSPCLNKI